MEASSNLINWIDHLLVVQFSLGADPPEHQTAIRLFESGFWAGFIASGACAFDKLVKLVSMNGCWPVASSD